VLAAARGQLAEHGVGGFSIDAVARAAGTTRQAVYRRWPTKQALAAAAISSLAETPRAPGVSHPFVARVAELHDFRRAIQRPGRLALVGTMLQPTTGAELAERYHEQIVRPRRHRLRATLERAAEAGLIHADADLEVAVTMLTGSWYARCLAGDREPEQWPRRTATLVWHALGGHDATV
jgi:AcrR family transcriptional regulator